MTALPRPLEAPVPSADVDQLEALGPEFIASCFDLFRVGVRAEDGAVILPLRPVVGLRLRGLHQPRRRAPNSAPSEEHQTNHSRPREFHHTFDVADPARGWKS